MNKPLLTAQNVDFSYGHEKMFDGLTLHISANDRIGLVGTNGCGKSTLLKILAKDLNISAGEIINRNRMVMATVDQFVPDKLNEMPIYDIILAQLPNQIRNDNAYLVDIILKDLGFAEQYFDKKIAMFSGREKACILFIKLNLQHPNFIILDEPTNHIDLYGREELIKQLISSGATLLIIGHDRKFCDIVGTRLFMIERNKLIEIDNPDIFYDSIKAEAHTFSKLEPPTKQIIVEDIILDDDDIAMERILELEALLEAYLARKAKHQKPQSQQVWRKEITKLYADISI